MLTYGCGDPYTQNQACHHEACMAMDAIWIHGWYNLNSKSLSMHGNIVRLNRYQTDYILTELGLAKRW